MQRRESSFNGNEITSLQMSVNVSEKLIRDNGKNGIDAQICFYSMILVMLQKFRRQDEITLLIGQEELKKGQVVLNEVCVEIDKSHSFDILVNQVKNAFVAKMQKESVFFSDCKDLCFFGGSDHTSVEIMKDLMKEYDLKLGFYISETSLGMKIDLHYNPSWYQKSTVQNMQEYLSQIVARCLNDMNLPICELDKIAEEERNRILGEFNDTGMDYNKTVLVDGLFKDMVSRFSDKTALVFEEEQLTYGELLSHARQIAHRLIEIGVKRNDFVGMIVERGTEMIAGIYGILLAGAAYVPIDPTYPAERIHYILNDCKPSVILTNSSAEEYDITNINLLEMEYRADFDKVIDIEIQPSDLAYCIYTSGTSGKPKGVLVEHRNLLSMIKACIKMYDLTYEDTVLQVANYIFDQSVCDIFCILSVGGTLCIASYNTICSMDKLPDYSNKNNVTILPLTPSLIAQLDENRFETVRILDSGGEAANIETFKRWRKKCKVLNTYGPTEATVNASSFYWEGDDRKSIPIGKPLSNTHIYIMDGNTLCGIGVPGELFIAGDGVTRGYLNMPELTKEKFVNNPFGEGRMYRTGDLARWLEDGNIEYLGRIDEQIKIHGFRIELDEIENVIRKLDVVRNCAVIVRECRGELQVLAYLVSDIKLDMPVIRDELGKKLPHYMIPSCMIQIEKIPVTRNGKLDKKALPDIEYVSNDNYVAPRTDMEKAVNQLFCEVLKMSHIGIKDDFFYWGGHSIKAIQLLNRIKKIYGSSIDITDFFQAKTVEKVCELITGKECNEFNVIPIADGKYEYEMSSTQRRLYLIWKMNKESLAYNLPDLIHIKGDVDLDQMNFAFRTMLKRHEILRTAFILDENGNMLQHILQEAEGYVEYEENDNDDESTLARRFIKPFDLEKPPFVRIKLIKRKEECLMIIDKHHIISDGISDEIFIKEFTKLYNGGELEPLRLQYKDYSEWFKNRDLSSQKEYWVSVLEGEIPVLNMPEDYKRPLEQSVTGSFTKHEIPLDIMNSIESFATSNNVTEYMIFLSAIFILLGKYSMQDDIIIGIPLGNRMHIDTEDMLGMFVNTALVRGKPKKDKRVIDFVLEIKEQCLKAYKNQEYPLEELAKEIKVERIPGRNLFFDVMFAMQNYDKANLSFHGAEAWYGTVSGRTSAMFDLTFNGTYLDSGFEISLEYSTDLYKEESAQNILKHLVEIIKEIVKEPKKAIGSVNTVSNDEKKVIIERFNQTECDFEDELTIVQCFEKRAELYADNIAVVFEDTKLTYDELNRKANRLARKLRDLGIGRDDFVGMLTKRSCEMVVGILAVLKAGGAFVPIDPECPAERIKYILEDITPRAILVYYTEIETDIPVIDLADESTYPEENENLELLNQTHDLAYCIYTSGTTGKPKGVLIEHTGVLNLKQYFVDQHKLSVDDRVLKFANYIFDASISELCMSILVGASLYIVSEDIIGDSFLFQKYISDNHISIAIIPPVYLSQIRLEGLRTVISAGSEITVDLVQKHSNISVFSNDYGPTEVTVCATYWKHASYEAIPDRIPIGKPINNKKVYIMQDDNLVGIGIPGELCVGGTGLARGYHNLPELTKEKFVDNPFGKGKMYRTGDLARWLPDGNIEYLGRIDGQVKIRGFRVELSEIEIVFRETNKIRDCAVVVKGKNPHDKAIYAYYVSDYDLDVQKLRDELGRKLPDYMIPAFFVRISQIPVTRNGKLNQSALPDVSVNDAALKMTPKNEIEKALHNVFEEILGIDNISTDDSFFTLGGDSIKAIRIVSKMREKGYSLQVKDIINKASIIKIAGTVKQVEQTVRKEERVSGCILDTPIIKQFKEWNLKNPAYFNQDALFEVKTDSKNIISKIMYELIKHHDMLRGVLRNGELEILDIEQLSVSLNEVVIDELQMDLSAEIEKKCAEVQKSFDLENGPLIKGILFITSQHNYLYLCIHHLVVDNVSWRILLSDYGTLFHQIMNGDEPVLPEKTASFKEWSQALREYVVSEQFRIERSYWEKQPLNMVCALKGKVASTIGEYKEIRIALETDETTAVLKQAGRAYHTEINDLLLTALGMSIYRLTGCKENVVFLEGHGREKIHKEINIDRTVGWFTSVYPVIVACDDDIQLNIIRTKEMLRRVPNHGFGYGLYKDSSNAVEQSITFNYFGEIDNENREMFQSAEFCTGKSMADEDHSGNIEINGYVRSGRMVFEISFKDNCFGCEIMERWAQMFKDTLIEITRFCVQQKKSKKTASDYVVKDITWNDLTKINDMAEGRQLEIDNILPLTPLQQGMWFHAVTSKVKSAYLIQNVFHMKGDVNVEHLEKSINLLMFRYDVLRISIMNTEATQPFMIIWKDRKIEMAVDNLVSGDDAETVVEKVTQADIERGFVLSDDTLLRIHILKEEPRSFYMVWTVHHIIVDGWSLPILFGKFAQYYNALSNGAEFEELKAAVALECRNSAGFKDFIEWRLEKNESSGLLYWKKLLKGYEGVIGFVQEDFSAANAGEKGARELKKTVPEKLRGDLVNLSNRKHVTLNSIVETAFGILLQKACCLNDVVYGKIVSGRNADIEGINEMVGLCINTIPIRVYCDADATVSELLDSIQKQSLESSEYDYCALSEIQKQVKDGADLVQTVVAFENYYISEDNMDMKIQDCEIELMSSRDQNEFSLSFFTLMEDDGKMSFEIIYSLEKYSKEYIDNILSQMLLILEKFVEDIDMKIIKLQRLVQLGQEGAFKDNLGDSNKSILVKIIRRR